MTTRYGGFSSLKLNILFWKKFIKSSWHRLIGILVMTAIPVNTRCHLVALSCPGKIKPSDLCSWKMSVWRAGSHSPSILPLLLCADWCEIGGAGLSGELGFNSSKNETFSWTHLSAEDRLLSVKTVALWDVASWLFEYHWIQIDYNRLF